jgi:diguanylate cyclase (GGDEF)-like protein/PAS domain S-box-containing protein
MAFSGSDLDRQAMHHSPVGHLMVEEGAVTWANPRAAELLGFAQPADLTGRGVEELLSFEHHSSHIVRLLAARPGQGQLLQTDWTLKRRDGSTFVGHLKAAPLESEGQGRLLLTISDISWRKDLELALRESEERVSTILDSIRAGIVIIDPHGHKVVDANSVALEMLGRDRDQVLGQECHRFICPAERGQCPVTDLGQEVDNQERALLTARQEEVPILKTVARMRLNGREHLLESFLDITEMKELQESLHRLATTDPLTGLYNRRSFFDQLHQELSRAGRYRRPLTLLFLDVDHFKEINDRHGHPAGDQALKSLALLLQAESRRNDIVGRIGGEEFATVLVECGLDQAREAAERLRRQVERLRVDSDQGPLSMTVSIGLAQAVSDQERLEQLLKRADRALYQAKRQGRNRVSAAAME